MEDERYAALLQVYQTLPRLDVTTMDVMGLEEEQYAMLLVELGLMKPEPFTEDASEEEDKEDDVIEEDPHHLLLQLRSDSFWEIVQKAMNTRPLQRFLMEQLVLKHYVQHRIFFCPREEEDEWYPCDVHPTTHAVIAPDIFKNTTLMHQGEDVLTMLVLDGVVSPFGPLLFQDVYAYLDHGFVMKEKEAITILEEVDHLPLLLKEDKDGHWVVGGGMHLHLLDDVDPAYFEEIFNVGEKGGFANRYLSPLLVHDIVIHAAPVNMKGDNEDLIEYINAMLPTISAPYQRWYQQNESFMEAPFFLHSLFKFLALTY